MVLKFVIVIFEIFLINKSEIFIVWIRALNGVFDCKK